MIYLDGAANYPLLPCVKKAMKEAMDMNYGNASALHSSGVAAKNLIEEARKSIAKLINADPDEIIFTSGGSESNNTIMHIFENKNIIISAIEHPSILEPAKQYAKNLTILPVNEQGLIKEGLLGVAQNTLLRKYPEVTTEDKGASPVTTGASNPSFGKSVCDRTPNTSRESICQINPQNNDTQLISIMLANNELGTIEPLEKLFKEKPKNVYFHSDLTQALGKIEIDVKKLNLDYATISAHKLGGPIGIGAIYVKKGSPFKPLIFGGHQEKGKRAGTYPVVQIAGFKAAADYALENHPWKTYQERVRKLRNDLAERIKKEVPFSNINTPLENSLPNILNVSFEAAEGESIQLYLDLEGGIEVSTGSACASGDGKPSHVIMATRNDAEVAHSSIRFSFTLDTTEKDIDEVMKYLPKIIKNLQSISTIKTSK